MDAPPQPSMPDGLEFSLLPSSSQPAISQEQRQQSQAPSSLTNLDMSRPDAEEPDEEDIDLDGEDDDEDDDDDDYTDASDSSSDFPALDLEILNSATSTSAPSSNADKSNADNPITPTTTFPSSAFPPLPAYSPPSQSDGAQPSTTQAPNSPSPGTPLLPPFYNKPPTPVPPSPSFASLIVPTAPATPYASDEDVAAPISPTSPKVPTYEYYGFALYLFSSLAFLIYLLWSFLPSPFLHVLGIYYYPNRWWSLAIPSFLVMTIVYIYLALASFNIEVLTPPLNSIETIIDDAAKVAVVDARGRLVRGKVEVQGQGHQQHPQQGRRKGGVSWGERGCHGHGNATHGHGGYAANGVGREMETGLEAWCVGTDAVLDIPLAGVCEMLYAGREWGEWWIER